MTLVGGGAEGRTCVFRASRRSSVWQVTRDEAFYGDFLTRNEALKSACSAARSFEAGGGTARVLSAPGDVVIAHHLPIHTR